MAGFGGNLLRWGGQKSGLTGGSSFAGKANAAKGQSPALAAPETVDPAYEAARLRTWLMASRQQSGARLTTQKNTRGGTLLTTASGLTTPAPVARKSLLGG